MCRLKLAETANIQPLILDLSSLIAVRKAAPQVNAQPEPLHLLIHNAAAAIGSFKLTADNLESQMATNHIGPFLFTKLLAPKIIAARTAHYTPRVIFVSESAAHLAGTGVNVDTLGKPDPDIYQTMETYWQTKSANVSSAIESSKRSKGQINYSLHPGGILGTDGLPTDETFPFKTIPQGAATTLVAAFDPRLDDQPGAYLADCVVSTAAPHSSDPANAEKLWTETEKIIGEAFVF
ncbi:putative short-chain dehydrogenase [Mycena polygramma]|nr:putative short-chain dehydrogenase [Mycena polygramma]